MRLITIISSSDLLAPLPQQWIDVIDKYPLIYP